MNRIGRYHKLLLITEIIFCSNPKAVGKILLFSYQSNVNFWVGLQKYIITADLYYIIGNQMRQ